ncbi:LOW QUALITY PROTEIN: transmembrane glycoprotein NMB-like [Rhinophrynus dorsalis]
MVVCSFYLQGRCRFGDKCWNEHPRDGGGSSRHYQQQSSGRPSDSWGHSTQRYVQPSTFSKSTSWTKQDSSKPPLISFSGSGTRDDRSKNFQSEGATGFPSSQNRFSALSSNLQTRDSQADQGNVLEELRKDMESWESSGQWLFSVYTLSKEKRNVSGFTDLSPEELRLEYYTSHAEGNLQNYMNSVQQLANQQKQRIFELKNPSASCKTALVNELTSAATNVTHTQLGGLQKPTFGSSSFSSGSRAPDAASFSFKPDTAPIQSSGMQSSMNSTGFQGFGGKSASSSGFGDRVASAAASFSFAKTTASSVVSSAVPGFGITTAAPSFGASSNTGFGKTPGFGGNSIPAATPGFGAVSSTASVFGASSSATAPGFGGSSATAVPSFGGGFSTAAASSVGSMVTSVRDLFKSGTSSSGSSSTFGQPSGPSANNTLLSSSVNDSTTTSDLFTPRSDLSSEDLKQFEAKQFTLGNIPLLPPPEDLLPSHSLGRMKHFVVGYVVLLFLFCVLSGIQAVKRFQDVMVLGRQSAHVSHHNRIHVSPGSNSWDEKLYPSWKAGDARWDNCWKGGKVTALLTSDSPALIGSNVTFAVNLQFPRCQKEDENGDIVYERQCRNDSATYQDQYIYNWTKWIDFCNEGNCSFNNKFPDGKPFPYQHDWRRRNFIYIFQTLGQYFQQTGRSSAALSINTTNITVGPQIMEVSVYRRGYRRHYPVAKASGMYIVTDQIPFYVNISQKNDRNSSDNIFIKDSPITFDVKIHDPSNYLNKSVLSFQWNFGDGSGSFVSNNPLSSHNYTLLGNFSLNLTIKAAIPGPCKPFTSTQFTPTTLSPTTLASTTHNTTNNHTEGQSTETAALFTTGILPTTRPYITTPSKTTAFTTEVHTTPSAGCFIYRYGYYKANITIVDGILQVNIIEMTNVQVFTSQVENALVDFVVTCQGSLPTDACTVISDFTCMVPQNMVCDQVPSAADQCLLTLRRAFAEPGTYCVNITLRDDASLALASTLVSVSGRKGSQWTVQAVLIPLGLVALIAAVIGTLLYRKYKVYRPVTSTEDRSGDRSLRVYFSQIKTAFFQGNNERDPLLKTKPGII